MKKLIFLFFFLMTMVVAGCGSLSTDELDPSEPGVQEGYIIDISESRILVVSDITKEQALELTQPKLLEGDFGSPAIWFTVEDPSLFEVGMLVRVKYDIVLESYPGQSEAIKVQIVEE